MIEMKRQRSIRHIVVVAALMTAACSGPARTVTAPSPGIEIRAISLRGPSFVRIGTTAAFEATVTFADGSQAAAEKLEWRVDDATVAQVDNRGLLTPLASGATVVRAVRDGLLAEQPVRVTPDYEKQWAGGYVITRCYYPYCRSGNLTGEVRPFLLTLSQHDDQVVGEIRFIAASHGQGPVSGTIDLDGTLRLIGGSDRLGDRVYLVDWQARTDANQTLEGTFSYGPSPRDVSWDARLIGVTASGGR